MEYITLRLPGRAALSGGAARTLVAYALRLRGRDRWDTIRIEAFAGKAETLLLACPGARVVEVRLADYALPLLRKYFTE